jgi:23S rRNA (cytosine1962-C5)-methyltransferase
MIVLSTQGWDDYELLDSGNGNRLERFGAFKLARPDPQAIWQKSLVENEWMKADAVFAKEKDGKEKWVNKNHVPEKWLLHYKNISFWAKLSPFKHTGVFPEQTLQWDWIQEKIITSSSPLNILNLFAYTGIASLVAASAGAKVTHVDASKPTIMWARGNQKASKLENKQIRWILDDAILFTQRDVKRGVRYDGIIMDPPVYGHGPNGERWDFNQSFPKLLEVCQSVLSAKPQFILINAYAVSASALMLENILKDITKGLGGTIEVGELALQEKSSSRLLSTGIFGRWSCPV